MRFSSLAETAYFSVYFRYESASQHKSCVQVREKFVRVGFKRKKKKCGRLCPGRRSQQSLSISDQSKGDHWREEGEDKGGAGDREPCPVTRARPACGFLN